MKSSYQELVWQYRSLGLSQLQSEDASYDHYREKDLRYYCCFYGDQQGKLRYEEVVYFRDQNKYTKQ